MVRKLEVFRKMFFNKLHLYLLLSGIMGIYAFHYWEIHDRVFFTTHEEKELAILLDAALRKFNLIEIRNYGNKLILLVTNCLQIYMIHSCR